MKIAVNRCFGGFRLSDLALEWIAKKYNIKIYKTWDEVEQDDNDGKLWILRRRNGEYSSNTRELRTDYKVIDAIETLEKHASSPFSRIEIVDIPDDIEYEIYDYDGQETIREKHRSW